MADVSRRKGLLPWAAAALTVLTILTLAAASPGASGAAARSDVDRPLTASMGGDIRSTNPGVNRDQNTDVVMMHVVEGLVGDREDGSPAPMLAQRIEVSPDGRTYSFTLRRNVYFHNGALMTAADVVWTWRRYLDPKTGWVCLPDFDGTRGARILSVTAPDSDHVVFKLDRAQPMLLTQMAAVICGGGGILHPSSVQPNGDWRWPVGTGPYRLEAWRRGEAVELVAFPKYASLPGPRDGYVGGKIAYAPRIRFAVIRDPASRLAALVKGQVDIMTELTAADFSRLKRLPAVRIATAPLASLNVILIQQKNPWLRDPRFRRALELSIDRQAVTLLATNGTGTPNASMTPANSSYYDAVHGASRPPNLAEARRLLAAAGYRGQPIVLTTDRRYADFFDQALLVQAMAKKAGIVIKLDVTEWATQVDRYQSGEYELMSHGYSARPDPALMYDAMLGSRAKSPRKVWDTPQATELLSRAVAEPDPPKRAALFDQLHLAMLADTPLIALFNPADVNGVRKDVVGFQPWSLGRARLWGVRKTTPELR
jgi:peptide/nickel transport system substrate-binding protein